MITDTITKNIQAAMKDKDEVRLSTLRMLSSALSYEKIAKQHTLTEDEELSVVKKEAKIRNDALESLKNAAGKQTSSTPEEIEEKIKRQEAELSILKELLPEEMGEEELSQLVSETISRLEANSMKDMGRVIADIKAKVGMKADGSRVAEIVKQRIGGGM